jgi:hypothetical protein
MSILATTPKDAFFFHCPVSVDTISCIYISTSHSAHVAGRPRARNTLTASFANSSTPHKASPPSPYEQYNHSPLSPPFRPPPVRCEPTQPVRPPAFYLMTYPLSTHVKHPELRTEAHPEIYTHAPLPWTSSQTRFASFLMRSCT